MMGGILFLSCLNGFLNGSSVSKIAPVLQAWQLESGSLELTLKKKVDAVSCICNPSTSMWDEKQRQEAQAEDHRAVNLEYAA